MNSNNVKINFDNVNFSFEGIDDKIRLEKISHRIFTLLNKKIQHSNLALKISSNLNLDNLNLLPITINPNMSDQNIAEIIAAELYYKIIEKLH